MGCPNLPSTELLPAAYRLRQMRYLADARCGLLPSAAPFGYLHNRASRYCTHSGILHIPGKSGWNSGLSGLTKIKLAHTSLIDMRQLYVTI